MNNERYLFRSLKDSEELDDLKSLFDAVFENEPVGDFAVLLTRHFPGMNAEKWFLVEDRKKKKLAAGFSLIPWCLNFDGIPLKTAEMGIVGTHPDYRGQGLQKALNKHFDHTLKKEEYDLAIIQGVPGFYDKFGFHYAIPLENHINLQRDSIPALPEGETEKYVIRKAGPGDLEFLLAEDQRYRRTWDLTSVRDKASWHYILTTSRDTCYGSDIWIGEDRQDPSDRFYCRNPKTGFGSGLIVSESSPRMNTVQGHALFRFLKQLAIERDKPYIRLNLHNEDCLAKTAFDLGTPPGKTYAWQIKFPNPAEFLQKTGPILELRLADSPKKRFNKVFRLNFFNSCLDLHWQNGKLEKVIRNDWSQKRETVTFNLSLKHLPAIVLGHRTWQEISHVSPDIFSGGEESSELLEILFPPMKSWIHEQY